MSVGDFASFDPVHHTRELIDAISGAQFLCATAASPGRGRPRKDDFNHFVVMMMNFLMPPWAPPKNRTEARRRRKGVAKLVRAPDVVVAATGEHAPPEELAARAWVMWPVPKEAAPKRVRIEAVYRRWYDTCFLPCPDGAMEALRAWFVAVLRTRQDARA